MASRKPKADRESKTSTLANGKFEPNDKRKIRLEPTGEEAKALFLSRLTAEEQAALAELKASNPELCARWNDPFLMRFLWGRKLNVTRTVELLQNHMKWREEHDIENLDLDAIASYLRNPAMAWAPGNYTKQGHSVSYLIPRLFDADHLATLGKKGILHASYYILDLSHDHDMEISRKGTVIVEDFSGASFSHMMKVQSAMSGTMKDTMSAIQDNLPSRNGGIIIVNAPWYIRLLMKLARPMLKPKLRKKIHVCSVEELDQFFTPDQLPTQFGGRFEINNDWVEEVLAHRKALGEGTYVDPAPRAEHLVAESIGDAPVKTINQITEESRAKKQKDKKKTKDTPTADGDSDSD